MWGIIKTLVFPNRFGFISSLLFPKDLFFHSNALEGITFDEIRVGDGVSFEIAQTERGKCAVAVCRNGGPTVQNALQLVTPDEPEIEVISSLNDELVRRLLRDPRDLRRLHPEVFEELVVAFYKSEGFECERIGRWNQPDGGIDMLAVRREVSGLVLRAAIQCKRYSERNKVGVEVIRQLAGVIDRFHAHVGVVATTSYFTKGAREETAETAYLYDINLRDFDNMVASLSRLSLFRMTQQPIDPHAVRIPQRSGLAPCLYIPIAARDTQAIETYVGRILAPLAQGSPSKAFLVEAHEPEKRDERFPIWKMPQSAVLHYPRQVWVHVDYTSYRRAYQRAFPDADLTGFVIDHVMNRREARVKGFVYLRVVPITREANSSHGGLSEIWGVDYHSSPQMQAINKASQAVVQYADLSDIVKMLDLRGGGSLMDTVNDAQYWVVSPKE